MPSFTPRPLDPQALELLRGYPAALFNQKFHATIELMHRYTLELAADILQRLGVKADLATWRTADELCRLMTFDAKFRPALEWLMAAAAEAGYLEAGKIDGIASYRARDAWWSLDLTTLRALGVANDPGNAATLDLLDHAAAIYPSVARGETTADHALFDAESIALWLAYFHNDNASYAVNNWLAALAAVERLADRSEIRVLEVGAGAGSGSELLLRLLEERGLGSRLRRYVVTEPSPFFLRRAQREAARRHAGLPLEFRALNIDKGWSSQGAPKGEFDLVFGVNVLHVAKDLRYSLNEAKAALKRGGWLVIGECLQSSPRRPIFPELIFQILDSFRNVQTHPEFRPVPGFLSPDEWRRAIKVAGFELQAIEPDVERIAELCPNFLAGAVCARA